MRRVEHPSGGSILITSAPRSANILPHNAPFSSVKSSSRNPLSNSDGIGKLNLAKAPAPPQNPVSQIPSSRSARASISEVYILPRLKDVPTPAQREMRGGLSGVCT